jgi:hypothetical protein
MSLLSTILTRARIDGFFLDRNESDAVYLDDIMCQDLSVDDKEALRSHGYYG